jgi:hypothetical protein
MCGPSCDSLVALAITGQGDEQQGSTPNNISALAQSFPRADPNAMEDIELEPQRSIMEGTSHQVEMQRRDAEDLCLNTPAHAVNNMDTKGRAGELSLNDDNGWERLNLKIRKLNKPPRVRNSGKFTRSSVTIGSLNIAGRDTNISIHNRNHKFQFLKQTIDSNNLGVLGMRLILILIQRHNLITFSNDGSNSFTPPTQRSLVLLLGSLLL